MSATRLAAVMVCTLVAAACGDEAAETVTSPETVTFSTAQFSNVIGPGGRRFYSFTLETSTLKIDPSRLEVLVDVPMYASDALVRHAKALQEMPQAGDDCVRLASATAARLGVVAGQRLDIERDGQRAQALLAIDDGLPDGVCLVHGARAALAAVAVQGAAVTLVAERGEAAA